MKIENPLISDIYFSRRIQPRQDMRTVEGFAVQLVADGGVQEPILLARVLPTFKGLDELELHDILTDESISVPEIPKTGILVTLRGHRRTKASKLNTVNEGLTPDQRKLFERIPARVIDVKDIEQAEEVAADVETTEVLQLWEIYKFILKYLCRGWTDVEVIGKFPRTCLKTVKNRGEALYAEAMAINDREERVKWLAKQGAVKNQIYTYLGTIARTCEPEVIDQFLAYHNNGRAKAIAAWTYPNVGAKAGTVTLASAHSNLKRWKNEDGKEENLQLHFKKVSKVAWDAENKLPVVEGGVVVRRGQVINDDVKQVVERMVREKMLDEKPKSPRTAKQVEEIITGLNSTSLGESLADWYRNDATTADVLDTANQIREIEQRQETLRGLVTDVHPILATVLTAATSESNMDKLTETVKKASADIDEAFVKSNGAKVK